jgi:flagellar hook-associated protein 1 FlgK
MKSTLSGFESIRKALTASQMGLDVTGQNIANVNTEGYTRQKVDLSSISSEAGTYRYSQIASVNVGGGVNVDGVSQIRDQFLDSRYIKENSNYNTYNTSTSALQDIENIFDEVNTDGLHARLSDFSVNLQTLSNNPDSMEFANIMRSSAQKVTEVLNQYYDRLQEIKGQRIADLNIIVDDSNTIVSKINSLNIEIRNQKLQGEPSNELIDTRNSNIDKLSNYLNISVEGQVDGTVSIKSGSNYLLNSSTGQITTIALDSTTLPVKIIKNDGSEFVILKGEIKGNLQILNGEGSFALTSGGDPYRGVPYYEESINAFSKSFADTFNGLNIPLTGENKPLFEGDSFGTINASTIKVSSGWLSDARYITTTRDPVTVIEAGNVDGRNDNIMRMINSMGSDTDITPAFKGTFVEFATSLMSDIAVDVNYNKDMTRTSELVLSSITDQRQSVTGVSLDEEAINMIRYQKSYGAAARLMTALDEMLDTLINKTGIVGR